RDGFVAALPIRHDGILGEPRLILHAGRGPNRVRQDSPHPHSVAISPDNRFAIICDLGVDRIYSYALDPGAAGLTPASPPFVATAPGAGPRHFKFGADGRHAFAINELENTITAYAYDPLGGVLSPLQSITTLPAGFSGENITAELRLHPGGRYLYGSNRGHDSIAVLGLEDGSGRMNPIEIVPSGGKTPRNFALSPDGRWLVCAHQDSDNLTVFKVDAASGRLTRTSHEAHVPMGVCVLFHH
ncbi:MAG: lactonase family protein, partial [Opitutus sp.]